MGACVGRTVQVETVIMDTEDVGVSTSWRLLKST